MDLDLDNSSLATMHIFYMDIDFFHSVKYLYPKLYSPKYLEKSIGDKPGNRPGVLMV